MLATLAIVFALSSIACMIGGPLLAHLALVPPMAGLALFALSALPGLAGVGCGAVAAYTQQAYFPAMIGMLGCLPAVVVIAGVADALRYPAINDITTDPADPPAFSGPEMSFPPANGPLITEHYPDVRPLVLPHPPEQVYRRARGIAASDAFAWNITTQSDEDFTFEAVATTRLFQWNDDISVRVRPGGQGGSVVDIRSKSREGKSDLGANARRIRHFLAAVAGA